MLYDMKLHLPQRVDALLEDFRTGNISQLEAGKIVCVKLLADQGQFNGKMKIIDEEHNKRKEKLVAEIEDLQKNLEKKAEELDNNEKDYWETIIGEITRTVNNIPTPSVEDNE